MSSQGRPGLYEMLLQMIKERNFNGVQNVISEIKQNGEYFRSIPPSCLDPVCRAAEVECDAIFNLLLQSGFDPDRFSEPHQHDKRVVLLKPLHIAACRGNVLFAKILIDKYNVPVDSLDSKGKTPLMWAVYRRQSLQVQYLISKGANVNHTDSNGLTPLFLSIGKRNCSKVLMTLIEAGSDVNAKVNSRCLFYKSAAIGRFDMAKTLYCHGTLLCSDCVELWSRRDIGLTKFLIEINAPLGGLANLEVATMFMGSLTSPSLHEKTDQWLDLLINAGHCVTVIDWDTVCEKFNDDHFGKLKDRLRQCMCHPKPLQQLCVFRMREILGCRLPRNVDRLPLPLILRRRIRLQHLYT